MAQIIELTCWDAPELDAYSRLTEAQLRNRLEPEKGIFIAESPKVIRTALAAGYAPVSFLMERKHLEGQAKELLAQWDGVPVYTADRDLLARLTGYTLTRGILCAMKRPPELEVESVCSNARRVAVLDGIVDTTNLGAIFRSAAALGMDGVLLSPTCCDPLNRRAIRVSMGTVFQVPWARLESPWPAGLSRLKAMGFACAALALDDRSCSIDDPQLKAEDRLAVLLGTEGDGLSSETVAACEYTVKIPMFHGVDSLNVAAAAAVAFWELRCPYASKRRRVWKAYSTDR